MNIECPVVITCPGSDDPRANFSSEAPDVIRFGATGWVPPWVDPGLPPVTPPTIPNGYFAYGCLSLCFSAISQEDADQCARNQAYLCSIGDGGTGGGTGVYWNQVAQCGFPCPDGTTFINTVPAGRYPGLNQAEANAIAQSEACRLAAYARLCVGAIQTECCNGATYLSSASATGGTAPITFTITAGVLPPGLVMSQVGDGVSFVISGTPTLNGVYPFYVLAQDAVGHTNYHLYTITVAGIEQPTALPDATEGNAYSETLTASGLGPALIWRVADGSTLPDGLNLNSASGEIYGTPTTEGDYTFTIEVENYA